MAKILFIEDDMLLSEIIAEWLTFENHEVIAVAGGTIGIKTAFDVVPDLILCDIAMPHMSGYDVLLEIRANPATATIPFIFLTALAEHESVAKGIRLGADAYIIKPFPQAELFQAIQTCLEDATVQD